MQSSYDVFISYAREDQEFMRYLKDLFIEAGLSVWTDDSMTYGNPSWQQDVERAITSSTCMVVIMSPDAKSSKWVEIEFTTAVGQDIRVIPLLYKGNERTSVPIGLKAMNRFDLSGHSITQFIDVVKLSIKKSFEPSDIQEVDEPEVYDYYSYTLRNIKAITRILGYIAQLTSQIGIQVSLRAFDLQQKYNEDITEHLQVIDAASADIDRYAKEILTELPRIQSEWIEFERNSQGFIVKSINLPQTRTVLAQWKRDISVALQPILGTTESLELFRQSVIRLPEPAQSLRRAKRRADNAIQASIKMLLAGKAILESSIDLIERTLADNDSKD